MRDIKAETIWSLQSPSSCWQSVYYSWCESRCRTSYKEGRTEDLQIKLLYSIDASVFILQRAAVAEERWALIMTGKKNKTCRWGVIWCSWASQMCITCRVWMAFSFFVSEMVRSLAKVCHYQQSFVLIFLCLFFCLPCPSTNAQTDQAALKLKQDTNSTVSPFLSPCLQIPV